jgi:hypothetical protein
MSSFLGKNRLRIVDYFSDLKATVDIHVETYIAENQHDQPGIDKLNKAREGWFKEADECETINLVELENHEDRDLNLDDMELLKRFCFIFEFYGDVLETGCFTWRFVSTDTHINPSQLDCFQMMIDFLDCDNCDYKHAPYPDVKSLRLLFKGVKSEFESHVVSFENFELVELVLHKTLSKYTLFLIFFEVDTRNLALASASSKKPQLFSNHANKQSRLD